MNIRSKRVCISGVKGYEYEYRWKYEAAVIIEVRGCSYYISHGPRKISVKTLIVNVR